MDGYYSVIICSMYWDVFGIFVAYAAFQNDINQLQTIFVTKEF